MYLLAFESCGNRLQCTCLRVLRNNSSSGGRRAASTGQTPTKTTTPAAAASAITSARTGVPRKEGLNWVRAPHPVSNIRLIEFVEKVDESDAEKQLRAKQIQVQDWNHEFWSKHNTKFIQERKAFVAAKQKEQKDKSSSGSAISAEEMSSFYKRFLDENYREHIKYNKEWYKKNVSLLLDSMAAIASNILRTLKLKSR